MTLFAQQRVPEIVHVVLIQAEKQRRRGLIDQQEFESKVRRLSVEELAPRGFILEMETAEDGRNRFTLKHRLTGERLDEIDGPIDLAKAESA